MRESLLDLDKSLNVLICLMLPKICRTDEPEHVFRLIMLDEIRLIRTVTRNSSVAVKILVKAFILRFISLLRCVSMVLFGDPDVISDKVMGTVSRFMEGITDFG